MRGFQKAFESALKVARDSVQLRIRKHSAAEEDFDPETLLYSLFEAEVPFAHIFDLFKHIIDELLKFNELREITERQLHGIVTNVISAYPGPHASVWVSNYHNVYDVDNEPMEDNDDDEMNLSASDPQRMVSARRASLIRTLIKEYLARQLEVESHEVSQLVDAEDLREATNRVLKIVRFAGFTEIRLGSLSQFVEELARSQKQFIHHRFRDENELKNEIALAERSFEAARKQISADPFKAGTELRLALELLGRVFLSACRLPSRPSRQYSFQYMHSLLKTLDHQTHGHKTQTLPKLVFERVETTLSA